MTKSLVQYNELSVLVYQLLSSCEVQWVVTDRVVDLHKQGNVSEIVQELHHTLALVVQPVHNLHTP